MEQAWLDSLSEDWVSQPRSSGSPVPSLPSNSTPSDSSALRPSASRIPKYKPQQPTNIAAQDVSNTPLSERSSNDINIPLSQRALRNPSKLRSEVPQSTRGRRISRTLSASTIQSTEYHTVQHKSHSLSPNKPSHETPEWKKRLLHGDVAYGEQRDLFSPGGLENIFRPPLQSSPSKPPVRILEEASSAMPSSPPLCNMRNEMNREKENAPPHQDKPPGEERQPRVLKYKLVDEGESQFSEDLSRGSSFGPMITAINRGERDDSVSEMPSDLYPLRPQAKDSRLVSGQSDIRNEELSPIYISRHNTSDGNIDYAALNLSADELQQRLGEVKAGNGLQGPGAQDDLSERMPMDMTIDSSEFARNGQFINLQRGGRSHEGLFMRRMLSPSSLPAIDESAMLQEESMQASTPKQLPNIRKTRPSVDSAESHEAHLPPDPLTPQASPSKSDEKGHKSSSGSPLKLFGTYDTFTNQKLLRRISQFEDQYDERSGESVEPESTHPEMNDAFVAPSSPEKSTGKKHMSRKANSFGEGDLDNFQFSENVSYDSNGSDFLNGEEVNQSLPVLNPKMQTKFKFQLDPSPSLDEGTTKRRTSKYTNTTTTKEIVTVQTTTRPGPAGSSDSLVSQTLENLETPRKRGDSRSKRMPKSPLKDPTPKRRRTVHETENERAKVNGVIDADSLREAHHQMQSVTSGRKRKDAKHGDDQQAANPKVLAMRQILRPRTPTPSQRSSQLREQAPFVKEDLTSVERAKLLQDKKIAKIQAELDSAEPPSALGAIKHMVNDSRKGSVTTEDFLDEAKKIMAGIRGKTRPHSGLTSLEESESENDRNISTGITAHNASVEDSYQESTQEPFSRPPSREGPPISRVPHKQQDPELLNHLRKYQEKSDMNDIIGSSIKSIAVTNEAVDFRKEAERRDSAPILGHENTIESDPPNIRITENPDRQRKRKHSSSSAQAVTEDHNELGYNSHGSNGSSSQSTSHSIPTGSSRGSDSRRVIPPHTVSHLIPKELAGMVFDQERNSWVKRKSVSGEAGKQNFLQSDETEEDPFGDIPDLSVDETQELMRLKAVAAKHKEEAQIARVNKEQHAAQKESLQAGESSSSKHASSSQKPEEALSSEPLRHLRLASKGTVAEGNAKAATWRDGNAPVAQVSQPMVHSNLQEEGVEQEISIHEDRIDLSSPRRRRNVTISFSSPIASVIQPSPYKDENSSQEEEDVENLSDNDASEEIANDSIIINKRNIRQNTFTKIRTISKNTSRALSIGSHAFTRRPISRIDEQDEDSLEANDNNHHQRSTSIIFTPAHPRRASSIVEAATPHQFQQIGTFELTPLSDFTMHQADESFGLEVSYIDHGHQNQRGHTGKKTLTRSIKDMIEKLTEVEPYEPFWEHIKKLNLSGKRLANLHKLDEFCENVEDLDVSNNKISQLSGAPKTIRNLRITNNYLSELTAWGHLQNLQYIDVSNNEIESLSSFSCLFHLRGLRADNNKITSLNGINRLDGLISLRLRGNMVRKMDFAGTMLHRLADLDLRDNHVHEIRNIHELSSLTILNLEENDLHEFSASPQLVPTLKYLKLSGNNLESIDVNNYPDLRVLYLDRNRLGTVTGLLKAKHLDSLSLREQQEGVVLNMGFLSKAFEVRKLFLSGNFLGTFDPQTEFLNLQYLELANCGLGSLPGHFGQLVANTRVLNLNFNALKDIKPLLGIVRLKKLHLAGNRLSVVKRTMKVLSQFIGISRVDLRNNPLTLGFYPPVVEKQVMKCNTSTDEPNASKAFKLGDVERERDTKYVARLDMDTKLLRRFFECLALGMCPGLKILDGLNVDRSVLELRDNVWTALFNSDVIAKSLHKDQLRNIIKEGILKKQGEIQEVEQVGFQEPLDPPAVEEIWGAEDSFA
ncbi:hypothetical protein B7494_g6749 [Chlorociboria aeruginascens]|nr:hypothetical protein B7494_g6749 [Chlorociboria aeruginascens]